ncbi:MAG TPA: response regulator [Acidimicrobiia bacterium]|nr:response regulator [Acidimicrobiia bacterium]
MGQRILVIEDSAVIRRLIEVCLRAADLDIHMSEDGPSGLEAVRTESPDLLVLDIGLPGMDGWQVLDHIRNDPSTRSLPVVVLTAHAEEESRRRADEGGADAFVTKPFQPNDFRQTVLDLLA